MSLESNTFYFVTPLFIFGMEVLWDDRHQPHTSLLYWLSSMGGGGLLRQFAP